ncbi:hypothetical protein ACP275_14G220400 [Erythranthe tilingii]
MNHRVPSFQDMEDDYSIPPPSSRFSRPAPKKTGEEEIMELLWQNGQVVVQTQNQRLPKKTVVGAGDAVIPADREMRPAGGEEQPHLFMQEDEMSAWLQCPLDDSSFDRDLYADLLFSAPPPVNAVAQPRGVAEIRLPPPDNPPRLQNFMHFSRLPVRPRTETTTSANKTSVITAAREATVVESNETPAAAAPQSSFSHRIVDSRPQQVILESGTAPAAAAGTCEVSVTSSPGGSRASFSGSGEQQRPPPSNNRKRKAREADENECQSEDIEFEAAGGEAKKQVCGSASTKRSRAAQVHNLSERRRRDRINEKMKALQELIPRCNKSDKASMLDEAIEYLKSLQVQVQMMSMGCGMVPMMYPGMQQYMPTMSMGMGMGMGMGMEMGMNRPPMVQYPSMPMPNPRFPMPGFHQPCNQTNPIPNPAVPHNQNQTHTPNFIDPYQQFHGLHPSQLPQNQGVVRPGTNKPSTSRDIGNPDNRQG